MRTGKLVMCGKDEVVLEWSGSKSVGFPAYYVRWCLWHGNEVVGQSVVVRDIFELMTWKGE